MVVSRVALVSARLLFTLGSGDFSNNDRADRTMSGETRATSSAVNAEAESDCCVSIGKPENKDGSLSGLEIRTSSSRVKKGGDRIGTRNGTTLLGGTHSA
jgi:hypothetical protein